VEGLPQFVVGVDGEICGSKGEEAARGDGLGEELACRPT